MCEAEVLTKAVTEATVKAVKAVTRVMKEGSDCGTTLTLSTRHTTAAEVLRG